MHSYNNLITQFNIALKKRAKFFICKKTKLNISILRLLLSQGFILSFYQFRFLKGNLCVFLKYLEKKSLVKKVDSMLYNKNLSFLKSQGDLQTNVFFIISTSIGGLFLLSYTNYSNFFWYNKVGGKILFKILV
jgi:ribosomal protein S8